MKVRRSLEFGTVVFSGILTQNTQVKEFITVMDLPTAKVELFLKGINSAGSRCK